jgi:hypothetical protein
MNIEALNLKDTGRTNIKYLLTRKGIINGNFNWVLLT